MFNKIKRYLSNEKMFPVIAAVASGLYPLIHYYGANFTFLNSWTQFFFFSIVFLIVPVLVFSIFSFVFKKVKGLINYQAHLITSLNILSFSLLIIVSIYGIKKKILAIAIIISLCIGAILFKHVKKIIVFQLIMALLAFFWLLPQLHYSLTYTTDWMQLPDDIEKINLKKKPNVYVIQPDGYVNFSELKKGHYNYKNAEFESYLLENNFALYPNYRSNYYSTLSSNSSLFSMKHHYHNNPNSFSNELYNARNIIAGNNPVISIFKNNNYKTHLILEWSYLLLNRPEVKYDYCNIPINELPFFSQGFDSAHNVTSDLEQAIKETTAEQNFYFIEKISPGHIAHEKSKSLGKIAERELYLKKIEKSNSWLKEIISVITKNDNNSLIIIVADHGGFVGLDFTPESKDKDIVMERDQLYSVFSSTLAIKWPNNEVLDFDKELTSSVNLFRVLFSYLGEDTKYLNNLQDDKSYLVINKNAPFGVYEVLDENGNVVFNKFND